MCSDGKILESLRVKNCQKLTSGQQDSLARTLVLPARKRESLARELDCSLNSCDSFVWYDLNTSCWRTYQGCFIGGWERFSESWPKAGMMRNGIAYRLPVLVLLICGKESLLLPPPL